MLSFNETVTVTVPALVGVPEMTRTPPLAMYESPRLGSPVTVHTYPASLPPEAVTVPL